MPSEEAVEIQEEGNSDNLVEVKFTFPVATSNDQAAKMVRYDTVMGNHRQIDANFVYPLAPIKLKCFLGKDYYFVFTDIQNDKVDG